MAQTSVCYPENADPLWVRLQSDIHGLGKKKRPDLAIRPFLFQRIKRQR